MLRKTIAFMLVAFFAIPAFAQFAAQKSSRAGVSVAVTPAELSATVWSFKVVLDTHSQELSDDLAKTAVLLDGQGGEGKALAWEGAAPGGHHREGVLKFNAFEPRPRAIELRINRLGESEPRIFRWELP